MLERTSDGSVTWFADTMPEVVLIAAFAWSTALLVAGGVLLLRASDTLHRVLALDVLVTIVIMVLTTLSYVHQVSYYIDAALALALLSFTATLVAVRYMVRGHRPS
jgi:multicomponent Na+:H+ antiporter subunit F